VFYVLGDHLFATEWKDGTWQAAVRLDAGSYAVDFGFKAYPLSGGRAVVLYRQAEDPRERLKARVYE
jgi:hypothetical protein